MTVEQLDKISAQRLEEGNKASKKADREYAERQNHLRLLWKQYPYPP